MSLPQPRPARLLFLGASLATLACSSGEQSDIQAQARGVSPATLTPSTAVGSIPGALSVSPSGTARYSIPLTLPPGRAGMAPSLSLQYDSGGATGLIGIGWSLGGMSSIDRCPRNPALDGSVSPLRYDDADPICLGGERLVLIEGAYGKAGSVYRTEIDRLTRVELTNPLSSTASSFRAYTTSGRILTYGGTEDSKVLGRGGIRSWALQEIRDRSDNTITFQYAFDAGSFQGQASTNNHRIDKIFYTGSKSIYAPPLQAQPQRRVEFRYADREPEDRILAFSHGARSYVTVQLVRIDAYGPDSELTRSYRLGYGHPSKGTGRAQLTDLRECDGANVCLPPTVFEYTTATGPDQLDVAWSLTPYHLDPASDSGVREAVVIDGDGDGHQDLLVRGDGEYRLLRARGAGDGPGFTPTPTGVDPDASGRAIAADFDGDGCEDFLRVQSNGITYYESSCGAGFASGGTISATEAFILDAAVADFSGDGLPDVMVCRVEAVDPGSCEDHPYGCETTCDEFECETDCPDPVCDLEDATWTYYRTSENGIPFSATIETEIPCATGCGAGGCATQSSWLSTDTDHDGKAELLQIEPALPRVFFNAPTFDYPPRYLAYSFDEYGDVSEFDPQLPVDLFQRYNANRVGRGQDRLVDVNGDGRTDVIRFEPKPGPNSPSLPLGDVLENFGDHFHNGCNGTSEPFHGAIAVVMYNTGTGFQRGPEMMELASWQAFCDEYMRSVPADWDGDGRVDLLFPREGMAGGELWVARSRLPDHAEVTPTGIALDAIDEPLRLLDFNGSGQLGLALFEGDAASGEGVWRLHTRSGTDDLLRTVTNGLGEKTTVEYEPMTRASVYQELGCGDVPDWVSCPASPRSVVSRVEEETTINVLPKVRTYQYRSARYDRRRRASLGLREHTVTEYLGTQPRSSTTVRYDNESYDSDRKLFPYANLPQEITTHTLLSVAGRQHVSYESRARVQLPTSTGGTFLVREQDRLSRTWEIAGSCNLETMADCADVEDLEGNQTPDTQRRAQVLEFNSYGDARRRVLDEGDGVTVTETRTFQLAGGPWLIAHPKTSVTVATAPGGATKTRSQSYEFDPDTGALLVWTQEPGSPTRELITSYGHWDNGNLYSIRQQGRDGLGGVEPTRQETTAYDEEGVFITGVTNPVGTTTTDWHRGLGVAVRTVDPNGVEFHAGFDGFGRPSSKSRSALGVVEDSAETIAYIKLDAPDDPDLPSRLAIRSTKAWGQEVYIEQDKFGREVFRQWKGLFGVPLYSTITYDPAGWTSSRSTPAVLGNNPDGSWSYARDELQRLLEVDPPFVGPTRHEYEGRVVTTTDPRDHVWTRVYDRQGRPKLTTDPLGTTVCQYYGAFGFPSETHVNTGACAEGAPPQAPPATATSYVIRTITDAYGKKLDLQDPNLGERLFQHNAFGEVVRSTDELQTTSFRYDGMGRIVERADADGITTYRWDQVSGEGTRGLPHSTISADGVERHFRYDAFARPVLEVLHVDGESFATAFEYDARGKLVEVDYPEGPAKSSFSVGYAYDPYGNMQSVFDAATSVEFWRLEETDPNGQVTRELFGNGVATTRTYDGPQLRTITSVSPAAASPIQRLSYDYDDTGNLTRREDLRTSRFETFDYDEVDRLWAEHLNVRYGRLTFEVADWSIDYGPLGNIESRSDVGTYAYQDPVNPLAATEVGGQSFAFDALGRQISRGNASITYAANHRTRSIVSPDESVTYTHDASHESVRKVVQAGTTTTETIYAGSLFERTTATKGFNFNRSYHYYVPGPGRMVARVRRSSGFGGVVSNVHYLHVDQLGSADTITSSTGEVVQRQSYDAFGKPRNDQWDPATSYDEQLDWGIGFTGHEELTHAGLVNMGGRMYDPRAGRFASADPYVDSPSTTQSFDRFSYVHNRPLNIIDPSGFSGAPVADAEGGGETGGGDDPIYLGEFVRVVYVPVGDYYNPGIYSNEYYREEVDEIILEPTSLSFADYALEVAMGGADALWAKTQEQAPMILISATSNPVTFAIGAPIAAAYFGSEGVKFWDNVFDNGVGQVALAMTPIPAAVSAYEAYEAGDVRGATRHGLDVAANLASWFVGGGRLKFSECFAAGTLVHAERGLVPIETVEVGERVLSRNPDTGDQEYRRVTRRIITEDRPVLSLTLGEGMTTEVLQVTPAHPFWVRDRGWTSAHYLVPGDELFTSRGGWVRVSGGTWIAPNTTVYNLEVEGLHSYFVGETGAWVHNACPRTPVKNVERVRHHTDGTVSYTVRGRTVRYDAQRYPDFSPFLYKPKAGSNQSAQVRIKLTGNRSSDFRLANEAAGFARTPKGYSWHHHQDMGLMQLVKSDLHGSFPHTGGVSVWQETYHMKYK